MNEIVSLNRLAKGWYLVVLPGVNSRYADEMKTPSIHQCRHWRSIDDIDTPSNQRKAVFPQIDHLR